MKNFLVFIGKGILLFTIMAFLFDYGYTKIFELSYARTKFQYFRSLKNQKVNYVFLGSSRVENSIVSINIEKKTGKKVLNLGFQAAKMNDIYILLKLIDQYKIHTDTVFIQIDYIFNIEKGYSNVLQYEIMPYIRENKVTKEYFETILINDKCIYYVPFYRYMNFDSKIGFRELIMNIVKRKTKIIENKGYVGFEGNMTHSTFNLPKNIVERNEYFNKIKSFAYEKNINVVYYFAPMSLKTRNIDFVSKLQVKIPNLIDFSSVVKDNKFFKDCTHLNNSGAIYFTDYFIENELKKTVIKNTKLY